MSLFRARYSWPDGRIAHVTFTAPRWDALRWAADYVRCFTGGYLLSISEDRPINVQLTLRG